MAVLSWQDTSFDGNSNGVFKHQITIKTGANYSSKEADKRPLPSFLLVFVRKKSYLMTVESQGHKPPFG